MANTDLAWLKWFPARAQNSLRWQSLTLEERGLFHELYDLAALANPRGALVAQSGAQECALDMLLSRRFRISAAHFRRILGALIQLGLMVQKDAQTLVFPDFATHQRNAPARVRRKRGAGVARKRRKGGAPEEEGEGEREGKRERRDRGKKKKPSAAAPPGFEEFWRSYPKKRQKKDALKAWKQATDKPALAVLLAALEAQKASEQWHKDGGQFIPYPASWLRAGSWDDEVGDAQRPQSQSDYLRPAAEVVAKERKADSGK